MNSIEELRNWVEVEYKQAKYNAKASRQMKEGFYHNYNTGRAAALHGVLDKIDVLAAEPQVVLKSQHERPDGIVVESD